MLKTKENSNRIKSVFKALSGYSFVLIFIVLFFIYYLCSSSLTWTGVTNIFRHSAVIGIISFGMGLVIISGEIDLSVGSALAFVGGTAIMVFNMTNNVLITLLFTLFCGIVCGFINGILIGKAKMPAFIVTLATMLIYRSVIQYVCNNISKVLSGGGNNLFKMTSSDKKDILFNFGNAKLLTLPMVGIFLILITVIVVYMTTCTKFGKRIFAVGSNEKAAKLAGVNTEWLIVTVFTLSGLLVGVAAFLWICMNGSVDPSSTGRSYEMYSIAAVVLGGISMSGGKGRCIGIIFGALSYTVIDKIIAVINVDSLINDAIKGSILIIAILSQTMGPVVRSKTTTRSKESNRT